MISEHVFFDPLCEKYMFQYYYNNPRFYFIHYRLVSRVQIQKICHSILTQYEPGLMMIVMVWDSNGKEGRDNKIYHNTVT